MEHTESEHELVDFDPEDRHQKIPAMEEEEDSDTRRDLFALKDSRLYHQSAGRSHHHGDRKRSNSVDGGYGGEGDDNVASNKNEAKKNGKIHDPSEL
jgi:hypothetical protein